MNISFLTIVKQIIADYGEAVLVDPKRVKAFFSDLAKDEPKSLRIAFGRCIEAGSYTRLKDTPDAGERAECKAAIAQRVFDDHGLATSLCAEALDILDAALYGEKKEPLRCAFCAKEIQDDWTTCPYCGTATKPENTPKIVPQNFTPQHAAAPQPAPQPPSYTPQYQSAAPAVDKEPLQYFFGVFKKYAVFSGRARRAEFLWFLLFDLIAYFICSGISQVLFPYSDLNIGILYELAIFIPSLALVVRRMHDCDKSGWFCLIPIYNLILCCTAGTKGHNRFGPDPKWSNP